MLLVWVAIVAVTTSAASCPCARPELCLPVRGPPASREVLAFSVGDHRGWDVFLKHVTTIALFGPPNITMLCAAHQRGVRVVSSGSLPLEQLLNSTARDEFVATSVAFAVGNHLDGFNLDFESPISTSEEQRALNDLFRDLRDAFRRSVSPNAQITLDIAWSPDDIDGRAYDYKSLVDMADFAVVMSYDEQSQIKPPRPCVAWANSPLNQTRLGVERYLQLGISARKLVLGLPWYGYHYPCTRKIGADNVCPIASVPFRGVNCSDAAGQQMDYRVLQALPGRRFFESDAAMSPFMNDPSGTAQYWFDDSRSLNVKKQKVMGALGLRGWAMWNAQSIDYDNATQVAEFFS